MKTKTLGFVISIIICLIFFPATNANASTPPVVISELQTGSSTSASEEFIELFNNSDQAISLDDYRIEYYSASATMFAPVGSPTQTINLSGNLQPKGYLLVASNGYLSSVSSQSFSSTFADAGGAVRLVRGGISTEDLLGWGTAKLFENTVHAKAGSGKSLSRISIGAEELVDTNNNSLDFEILTTPTPQNLSPEPVVTDPEPVPPAEEPEATPSPVPEVVPEETPPVVDLLPLQITEILPNPASPATDEDDEFVEIYNPNDQEAQLAGYRLEAGNSYSYKYTFGQETIPPKGYKVIYSKDSNLTLSNTTGAVRLLDPNGAVASLVEGYEDAEEGSAWANIDGVWQWTLTPTPATVNILRLPLIPPAKVASSLKPKSSKAKTSKPKASVKGASAKKSSKPKPTKTSASANSSTPELVTPGAIHPSVLVGVGVLALLYAVYEYRGDIRSLIIRLNRYRELRRGDS